MGLNTPDIQRLFQQLDGWPPNREPPRMALSNLLRTSLANRTTATFRESEACLFAAAAVEMWERAIHSLIIAVSLKECSESWACVAGYYASHYAMRAYAHLFGYFSLFNPRKAVEISAYDGRFRCTATQPATTVRREHQFYWRILKQFPQFADDPLFSNNEELVPHSDASHRGVASYGDLLNQFKRYEPLDPQRLRHEWNNLSRTALDGAGAVSVPNRQMYPQLGLVLLLAYLRIYRFHEQLDDILTAGGWFWRRHRVPPWCTDVINFPDRPTVDSARLPQL